jgi:hypothetical protein
MDGEDVKFSLDRARSEDSAKVMAHSLTQLLLPQTD